MFDAIQVTAQVRDLFLDRAELDRRIDAGRRRALGRQGAYVRRRARTRVLRRRKRPSQPGRPPSVHASGFASLRNIVFFYDPRTDSVVVGPRKLNQRQQDWIDVGSLTVPQIHEHGGVVMIRETSRDGGRTWWRRDMRRNARKEEKHRRRRAIYKPRPFMAEALEQEIQAGTIPASWQNAVRG